MKKIRFLIITILAIIIPMFFSNVIPEKLVALSFSLSITIKSIFITILPFIIFCFIFCSMVRLNAKKAIKFVILLLSCVFFSNLAAIFTGYFIGSSFAYFLDIPLLQPNSSVSELQPLWNFSFKPILRNEYALVSGFIIGIICSMTESEIVKNVSIFLSKLSSWILKYFFVPIIPLFILGSMFKLEHDGILQEAISMYSGILLVVVFSQILYLTTLYMVAANFHPKIFLEYLKNILPATITGFSTASSASALPILVMATTKNINSENAAKVIVPAAINIHTLGSALSITILCMTTLAAFGMRVPTLDEFYIFGFLYAISKFAVAGVPGGVILVMSPIIESYFHFSGDMLALITGIYVIFDPFGTATNVTANGAFAIIFNRISKKFHCAID